jgi:hypothetical protein
MSDSKTTPPDHHRRIAIARSHMNAADQALHVGEYDAALVWINRAGAVVTDLKERADGQ